MGCAKSYLFIRWGSKGFANNILLRLGRIMLIGWSFTFSIFGKPSLSVSPFPNIFSLGSTDIATSKNLTSKNGTRASKPQAIVDLVVIMSSYWDATSERRTYLHVNNRLYAGFWLVWRILDGKMLHLVLHENKDILVLWVNHECIGFVIIPPKISSLPSPLKTILTPIALIFRLKRYIGVLARTVVTSYVSKW